MKQYGAIRSRYHLGTDKHGFHAAYDDKWTAFHCAKQLATELGETVHVFDSMAHKGSQQSWEVLPSLAQELKAKGFKEAPQDSYAATLAKYAPPVVSDDVEAK